MDFQCTDCERPWTSHGARSPSHQGKMSFTDRDHTVRQTQFLIFQAIQVIRDKGADTKTIKRRSTSMEDSDRESPYCKVSKTDIDPSNLKSYSTREVWDLIKKNEKERAILMEEYEKRMRALA